jgi:hypothetical protein
MKLVKEETSEAGQFSQLSCIDWGRALMQPLCTMTHVKLCVSLQPYHQAPAYSACIRRYNAGKGECESRPDGDEQGECGSEVARGDHYEAALADPGHSEH